MVGAENLEVGPGDLVAVAMPPGPEWLPVVRVREKEVLERTSGILGMEAARLQRRVQEMGRAIGPPWTQDQKLAALAAWIALES